MNDRQTQPETTPETEPETPTEKERLQARAEELGLETDGTTQQLKEWIVAAEAEDAADDLPEIEGDDPASETLASLEDLPDVPVDPPPPVPVVAPVVKPDEVRGYTVLSSFWLRTSQGLRRANTGAVVKLTGK